MKIEKLFEKHIQSLPDHELDSRKSSEMIRELEALNKSIVFEKQKNSLFALTIKKLSISDMNRNIRYFSLAASVLLISALMFIFLKSNKTEPIKKQMATNQVIDSINNGSKISLAKADRIEVSENIKSIRLNFESRGTETVSNSDIMKVCLNSMNSLAKSYGLIINKLDNANFKTNYFKNKGYSIKLIISIDFKAKKLNILSYKSPIITSDSDLKPVQYIKFIDELQFEIESKLRMMQ